MHATGPSPMPPAPQLPPRPRSTPADWMAWCWTVVPACLALWAAGAGNPSAVRADAGLTEYASWAWRTTLGGTVAFTAFALAVGATVVAALTLRGGARWAAAAMSTAVALGALAGLVVWYLTWLT